ncbi:M14 family metallopeptidase [Niastella vici]|nr:M14 family metallopeptidase [Niastella vici]
MAQAPRQFQGQGPIKGVSTEDRPVQKQWKGLFSFPGSEVFFDNDFEGGRLNGVARINDSTFSALITSENTPVNESPWYAFKVWSKRPQAITIVLTYQQGIRHRYAPRLSKNGHDWLSIEGPDAKKIFETDSLPVEYRFHLTVSRDTTWVAAQELYTSRRVKEWVKVISRKPGVTVTDIGRTHAGRPVTLLKIGNPASKNRMLIIGRQHPPEVTGQLAMQAFIENLNGDEPLAKKFREQFLIYLVPMMNPDGVDEGFWRHNAGGVDLNRDWAAFNQPETRAVRDFLQKELGDKNNKLWFGLDFHSTYDDIFYLVDPKLNGVLPGFIPAWLDQLRERIPGYTPNVKPLYSEGPTYTSFSYLFKTYGTEALVYEIGDKTSRDFIQQKSKVAATALMEMLLQKVN